MFSGRSTKALVAALVGTAGLAMPTIAAADAIVVASTGPSAKQYPAGRKLADNQGITLRAGDSVTVLDERGTRVLRGAGTFNVSQASGPSRASTFAALTRPRGAQRVRTGAVRNSTGDAKVMNPNLWYLNVSHPGTHCIVDPAAVRLWRADAEKASRWRVSGPGGATGAISFDAGNMIGAWDAGVPVADGASFTLAEEGTGRTERLTFKVLPAQPAAAEDLAAALIDNGCTAQLELLTQSMALPED